MTSKLVIFIFQNGVRIKSIFRPDYEVNAKNCPDSFLLCNSSFVTQLMEMEDSISDSTIWATNDSFQ